MSPTVSCSRLYLSCRGVRDLVFGELWRHDMRMFLLLPGDDFGSGHGHG